MGADEVAEVAWSLWKGGRRWAKGEDVVVEVWRSGSKIQVGRRGSEGRNECTNKEKAIGKSRERRSVEWTEKERTDPSGADLYLAGPPMRQGEVKRGWR